MTKPIPDDDYGEPDDENPEWTGEDFMWSINNADFGGLKPAMDFLARREKFFANAAKLGFEREAFLGFQPGKPGFLDRVAKSAESLLQDAKLLQQAKHAAE